LIGEGEFTCWKYMKEHEKLTEASDESPNQYDPNLSNMVNQECDRIATPFLHPDAEDALLADAEER
jgi:hypothetical protein